MIALPEKEGGNAKLAALIGITPSAVSQWEVVPHNHCIKIEAAVDGVVTRYQMRPDVFGPPPKEQLRKAG